MNKEIHEIILGVNSWCFNWTSFLFFGYFLLVNLLIIRGQVLGYQLTQQQGNLLISSLTGFLRLFYQQEDYLVNGTIKDNMMYFPHCFKKRLVIRFIGHWQ